MTGLQLDAKVRGSAINRQKHGNQWHLPGSTMFSLPVGVLLLLPLIFIILTCCTCPFLSASDMKHTDLETSDHFPGEFSVVFAGC